ncbi:MAG: enoyl-CoA hydratase/isomerase family protein, partial [Pseudomonadota bacterium]
MTDGRIALTIEDRIATVTIDRPAKLNALTNDMLAELEAAAGDLDRNTEIRAIILTGTGEKAFCAGADIAAWGDLDPLTMWRRWIRDGHRLFDRLAQLRQ